MNSDALITHVQRNCPRLSEFLSGLSADVSSRLVAELVDSSSPSSAADRVDDLLGGKARSTVRDVLEDERKRGPFIATISGSRFLASILLRQPELVESLFLAGGCHVHKDRKTFRDELASFSEGLVATADFDRVLRRFKEREYLRIGCRDLSGAADVPEVMAELSDLATACTQAAVDFHWERLRAKHGLPDVVDGETGFVVIGMGKVSGHELNFSSDLDLIFLRGPEEGRTQGPASVSVVGFYETLARAVTKSLSDITEDGFVLRVDLRLRPEGENGELVPSIANAIDYYLGWGRTWERVALMKAVPLAGDPDLGEQFVQELEPFIYRKHLDYSTLDDMRMMKVRIEAQLRRKPGVNIKLGQGGIREVEFFVQTVQMINAGRIRRVRSAGTLETLHLLYETGLIDGKTAQDLRDAYLFFRKTEHRIQINHQLQTHELPRTREEQEELARRMGYRGEALAIFLADLDRNRRIVEELFSGMLRDPGQEASQHVSALAKKIADLIHDESATRELLAVVGFEDLAASYAVLKELLNPSELGFDSEKGRHLLERLGPIFLDELLKLPEPGHALNSLLSYIDSLHSASAYFSTFLENPATVRFLVQILGESRFFTDLLIRHPQSIDSLIGRGAQDVADDRRSLQHQLTERLADSRELEPALDALRRFKHEEILRIGTSQLFGDLVSAGSRQRITNLAEVCLNSAVDLALQEMNRRYGESGYTYSVPLVILGMGKLGGQEMTYLSDVDVIFVYEAPDKPIGRFSSREWFSRLASRIISILTAPTAEGAVFAIDTRLRPSGNQGPLVSSLSSFREYHRTTSKIWEKQALTRARPVAGPPELMAEVADIVRECLMRTEVSDEELTEIARLRKRMEHELAHEDAMHADLKTGRGGLVDVEFLVQVNILKHCRAKPSILCTNTSEALAALWRESILTHKQFETLDSGYRFLTNLEDRLRIMEHRGVDRMPLKGEKLHGLARRLGYGDQGGDALVRDYRRITGGIRGVYDSFWGG